MVVGMLRKKRSRGAGLSLFVLWAIHRTLSFNLHALSLRPGIGELVSISDVFFALTFTLLMDRSRTSRSA